MLHHTEFYNKRAKTEGKNLHWSCFEKKTETGCISALHTLLERRKYDIYCKQAVGGNVVNFHYYQMDEETKPLFFPRNVNIFYMHSYT